MKFKGNPFKELSAGFRDFFRKRRISVCDAESRREKWHTHMSPMGIMLGLVSVIFIIFCIILMLVAYTPVLDYLPGYRTDASKSRETLIQNLIRIDSLERKMNDMLAYNESIILVMNGKTPTMRTVQNDSLRHDKSIVPPSRQDSLLRREMEGNGEYALSSSSDNSRHLRSGVNAVSPMEGIISERFNARSGLYGIRITGAPEAQVVAIADGTVVGNDWAPETGNMVTVQHNNGVISIYRQLSGTIVSKGQRIKANEVIGYAASGKEGNEVSTLEFELWGDGKPIDPESYILF